MDLGQQLDGSCRGTTQALQVGNLSDACEKYRAAELNVYVSITKGKGKIWERDTLRNPKKATRPRGELTI